MLATHPGDGVRPRQGEMPPQQCLELRQSVLHHRFRVLLEALRERRPVTPLANGLNGTLQHRAVTLEQLSSGNLGLSGHGGFLD